MKNILVLTDSLGLPRDKPEKVPVEKTWPFLLKQKFSAYTFFQLSIGGGTVEDLFKQVEYYKSVNPEVVVVQSGIVDCAPRALRKVELQILSQNKILNKYLLYHLMKRSAFLRRNRKIQYTSQEDFLKYIKKFLSSFGNERLFWIGIIPALKAYENKLPGITEAIRAYNKIIEDNLGQNYIDTLSFPEHGVMSDFHHLNEVGHDWIFHKLSEMLVPVLNGVD